MYKAIVLGFALGFLGVVSHQEVLAQGTVFTYEGKLSQNGVPFSGTAEIAPSLWDAPANGNLVGTNNPGTFLVAVSNGVFTASLDFGSAPFAGGAPRWLQLGVRTTADPFSILTPLQPITATPYAITTGFAARSGSAANFSGALAGDVTGEQAGTVVVAVGGQAASAVASAVVAINGATSAAIPGSLVKRDASGGFVVGDLSAGNVTAVALAGNGADLTSINSSNLTGTVPLARLSGITSNQVDAATWQEATRKDGGRAAVATNFLGTLAGDVVGPQGGTVVAVVGGQPALVVGSAVAMINGATSSALPGSVVRRDAAGGFTVGDLHAGTITAVALVGNGANLSSLDAGKVSSGTIPLARLSGISSNQLDTGTWQEATLKDGGMAALATNLVSGISITNASITNATITGSVFSGNGANLISLSATNLTGKIPLSNLSGITSNQVDAATWQFLVNIASGLPAGMVLIPYGGPFTMGDTLDGLSDAKSVTNVLISPFYMDANLVTWAQWQGVYGYATNHGYGFVNSGAGKAAAHPVQGVDWYDVVKWCNARSEQAGRLPVYYTDAGLTVVYRSGEVTPYANWSVKGYRLPTEAEWEKASRGGLVALRFPWGNLISQTNANYYGATASFIYDLGPNGYNPNWVVGGLPYSSPVGSSAPNRYGCYDMVGNVFQWCWDWYGMSYAGGTDPRGGATGSFRVLRGGSWASGANLCRTASRFSIAPTDRRDDRGFRSVLPMGQ
ncbi:MAG: SUMF1/EgtB/PvdO family nonheme iron enzyme [Verrucomicrobiota bacterium]